MCSILTGSKEVVLIFSLFVQEQSFTTGMVPKMTIIRHMIHAAQTQQIRRQTYQTLEEPFTSETENLHFYGPFQMKQCIEINFSTFMTFIVG